MTITRRAVLAGSAATAVAFATRLVWAQAATPPAGPFTLPPLPYPPDANEPHVDAQTMTIHHDRHHAAYVANLNGLLKDHPQVAAMGLPDILARVGELPDTIRTGVRNNAGGHANHTMFWQVMGGKGGSPDGALAAAIDRDLGGMDGLKTKFNATGVATFGSGWVFVAVDRAGRLTLVNRPNQDTPLLESGRVLFGNDVWEHAYYLKYQNRRADYLAAWWNVVDWSRVSDRYGRAMAGTLDV